MSDIDTNLNNTEEQPATKNLHSVNWLPADVDVLEKVAELLGKGL